MPDGGMLLSYADAIRTFPEESKLRACVIVNLVSASFQRCLSGPTAFQLHCFFPEVPLMSLFTAHARPTIARRWSPLCR